ncbi:uncharacterized protein FRV6_11693 [Fusarium oxysporum]|uniref:Rhodopsin domain-containing protein n=1 Tax=Fusarium oxysporum TaxID=5507 RepID=A0A2H3TW75_FUSOX|nr:uncharacterized protein FRV6_11693 [Fusarium oxysporum]
MSFAVLYLRLLPGHVSRRMNQLLLTVLAAEGFEETMVVIFHCKPVDKAWNPQKEGTCLNLKLFYYISFSIKFVTDVCLFIQPIPAVWKLQLSKAKRLGAILMLSLGLFVCIIAIIRVSFISQLRTDVTKDLVIPMIWSQVEVSVLVVCASIPSLRPFLQCFPAVSKALGLSSSKDSRSTSNEGSGPTYTVDKVNFIKAYAKAREVGMTKKNILSGWIVTGNWPISRRKVLIHAEIQPNKKETTPGSDGHRDGQVDSDTPKTSRHIRDLGENKSTSTRRRYSVISKGFEAQESKIASLSTRIAGLEEEVGRLSRGKKRKAIPNPNKKFISLAMALAAGDTISEPNEAIEGADVVKDVIEVGGIEEDERSNSRKEELGVVRTRTRREVKRPRKY